MTFIPKFLFLIMFSFLLLIEEMFFHLHLLDESMVIFVVFTFFQSSFGGLKLSKNLQSLMFCCVLMLLGAYLATFMKLNVSMVLGIYILLSYSLYKYHTRAILIVLLLTSLFQLIFLYLGSMSLMNSSYLAILGSLISKYFSTHQKPLLQVMDYEKKTHSTPQRR